MDEPQPPHPDRSAGHLTPQQFRELGHHVVDRIADYWERLDGLPVQPGVRPGELRAGFAPALPEHGEDPRAVLDDLADSVLPGLTHWQHPRFFGYFPANSSPVAVLGDLLSSGFGVQGMLWATSPAATELEQHVVDAFGAALGLPQAFSSTGTGGGVIQDTASTATFTALLAALHRAGGGELRRDGVAAGRFTVHGSEQAHSSLQKAVMMAGLGERALRTVPVVPGTLELDVDALAAGLAADRSAGYRPVMVQAAVGTTGTGAVDPVRRIGELVGPLGVHLHVDAAWAGVAALCPELRWVLDGVAEHADSVVTNPHKWLLTTFDCSTLWVRDRAPLLGALSILPEYLRNPASESGAVVDYRDWHPQLGRRFRALKLAAVLRSYGLEGLRRHVRDGVGQARMVADRVLADPRLAFAAPPALALVTVRIADAVAEPRDSGAVAAADAALMAAMRAVNESGTAFFSHTAVGGRSVLRWATGGWRTTPADVEQAWQALSAALSTALADAGLPGGDQRG